MDKIKQALEHIRSIAEQYASNPSRQAQEVDHALCVEVLAEADSALAELEAAAAVEAPAAPEPTT